MNASSIDSLAVALLTAAGVQSDNLVSQQHGDCAQIVMGRAAQEHPDPAYWTDYDRYMIARDDRARRRADRIAQIVEWASNTWSGMIRPLLSPRSVSGRPQWSARSAQ